MSKLLSYSQAAEILGIHAGTLRRWVANVRIPHLKIGRTVRFDHDELTQWIRSQSIPVGGAK